MNYPWIAKANKMFLAVLTGQFVFGLIIAFFTNTWTLAIILGGAILALPAFLITTRPFDPLTRHVVAIATQLAAAVHIQQAQGLTEIHFEIFSMMAILVFYRDWKIIASAVAVVAIHHVLFFILQMQSMPFYIFESDNVYFYILLIHALFAVLEGAVLMYMANDSHKEAEASVVISSTVKEILSTEGKFNLNVTLTDGNRELREFNRLILSFKEIIKHACSVSKETSELAANVTDVTCKVNQLTAKSTDKVSMIATAIEQMAVTNEDVAKRAVDVSSHAESAQDNTNNMNHIISDSHTNTGELKTVIATTADTIQNLSVKCEQIAEVMNSITAISDQTNLLALNAAIESARAGEHGRGFAVVADEVRQLATKTRENAESISAVVSSLTEDANLSVSQMANCIDKVEEAVSLSEQMSSTVADVSSGILNVTDNIQNVAAAIEQQVSASESISTSAQDLHQSSETQTEDMAKTRADVAHLQDQIDSLNKELVRFTV